MSWSGIGRAAAALFVLVGTASPAAAQDGPTNRALIDTAATADVLERARSATEELFTFTYTDLAGHKATFAKLTTGTLRSRYDDLFDAVVTQATTQKVSLTSTVADAAVRVLRGDAAEVLVFMDQSSTRAESGASTQSKAMFLATLRRVDGDWRVADLNLFEDK